MDELREKIISEFEEFKKDIENGKYKVDSKTGTISEKGNVTIPATHHYGKVSKN